MTVKTKRKAMTGYRLKKACRCKGQSTGWYTFCGMKVPYGIGAYLGGKPHLKCNKCGKKWTCKIEVKTT